MARKPRDYDSELAALMERAKKLKGQKTTQLGELVQLTGADALPVEALAGALLAAVEQSRKQPEAVARWAERGEAFFRDGAKRAGCKKQPCFSLRSRRLSVGTAGGWFRLPRRVPGDEGVGYGDQLSCASDRGDGVVLAGGPQPFVGRLQHRVPMLCCGEGGEEDGAAEAASAAGDVPLSGLLATIGIEGCDADQGSGLSAGEPAELRHADDEGGGGDVADARDAEEDVKAAGEVGGGTQAADEAGELSGAAPGQALDLGLEETQRCGFAVAFEACLEASNILGELLDQGEVLGEWCQALGGERRWPR